MNTVSVAWAEPVMVPAQRGTARIIPFRPPRPAAAAATPPPPHPVPMAPPLAIIRRPARSVMQAGRRDPGWVLEFEPAERPLPDPLMGWLGSGDVHSQIRIPFPTRASAERFAQRAGLPFVVVEPPAAATRPRPLDLEKRLSN